MKLIDKLAEEICGCCSAPEQCICEEIKIGFRKALELAAIEVAKMMPDGESQLKASQRIHWIAEDEVE